MKTKILALLLLLPFFVNGQSNIIGKSAPTPTAPDRMSLYFKGNEIFGKDITGTETNLSSPVASSTLAVANSTANSVIYNGNTWIRKPGSLTTNVGTIIKTPSNFYYERIVKGGVIDMADYGCTGLNDGTNDDLAMTNAVADAIRLNIKTIFFSQKYYKLYDYKFTGSQQTAGMRFIGSGSSSNRSNNDNATTLMCYGDTLINKVWFETGPDDGSSPTTQTYAGNQGLEFRDMYISCLQRRTGVQAWTNTFSFAFYIPKNTFLVDRRGGDIRISNVTIRAFEQGFWGYNSDFNRFTNVTFWTNKNAIKLESWSDQFTGSGVQILGSQRALDIAGCSSIVFYGSHIITCGTETINPMLFSTVSGFKFDDLWLEQNGDKAIDRPVARLIDSWFEFTASSYGTGNNSVIEANNVHIVASPGAPNVEDRRVKHILRTSRNFIKFALTNISGGFEYTTDSWFYTTSSSRTGQIEVSGYLSPTKCVALSLDGLPSKLSITKNGLDNGLPILGGVYTDGTIRPQSTTITPTVTGNLPTTNTGGWFLNTLTNQLDFYYNNGSTNLTTPIKTATSIQLPQSYSANISQLGKGGDILPMLLNRYSDAWQTKTLINLEKYNPTTTNWDSFTASISTYRNLLTGKPLINGISLVAGDKVRLTIDAGISYARLFTITHGFMATPPSGVSVLLEDSPDLTNWTTKIISTTLATTDFTYLYNTDNSPSFTRYNRVTLEYLGGSGTANLTQLGYLSTRTSAENPAYANFPISWDYKQGVIFGITNNLPHASSLLDVAGTSFGTRPYPLVTAVQRNAITSPAGGLIVYQTDAPVGIWTNVSGIGWRPNSPVGITATLSGDGTTTTFTIPHGLGYTPTQFTIVPNGGVALGIPVGINSVDGTNIIIKTATAIASGTNNIVYYITVK